MLSVGCSQPDWKRAWNDKDENRQICLSGEHPDHCNQALLTPQERNNAQEAVRRHNLEICVSGEYPSLCNQALLTPQERADAREAVRKHNLAVCLSGEYPSLCNQALLKPQERADAQEAVRKHNLAVCLSGEYPSLCNQALLKPQERADAQEAVRKHNLAVCLSGEYPSLCNQTLLKPQERADAQEAVRKHNLAVCLSGNYQSLCNQALLTPQERKDAQEAVRKHNLAVCLSGEYPSLCNQALLTPAQVKEAREAPAKHQADVDKMRLQPSYFEQLLATPEVTSISAGGTDDATLFEATDSKSDSDQRGLKLVWVRVSTTSESLGFSAIEREADARVLFERIAETRDAALVGGTYWRNSGDGKVPEGLLIVDGNVRFPMARWTAGGFLRQAQQGPSIRTIDEGVGEARGLRLALQSKPVLVDNGQIALKGDLMDRSDRIAVGNDDSGAFLVCGAFRNGRALSLVEFARFLCIPRSRNGPGFVRALNLDGGPGAHLYIPRLHRHFGIGGVHYVPNILHIRAK
jgi:hypothetical protein